MTTRELLNAPTVKLVTYAVLLGVAWADLRSQVANKAEKAEVVQLRAEMQLTNVLIQSKLHDIKAILCAQTPKDSMCAE